MKQKFTIIITTMLLTLSTTTISAGWMDDWVDQSTSSGANYFQGQQRGYFTGGSYSARMRNKKEYLFSIQKPKLKSGCGGIDLFMGGFSFMDPEYLMQKMQRAIQAAPAIAFDLALKSMAQEISSSVGKFEGIINSLNNLQMDECGTSKELVGLFSDKYDNEGGMISEMQGLYDTMASAQAGSSKNYKDTKDKQAANNGEPIEDQKKTIEGCTAEFKNIFTTPGSILNHITKTKGMENYADYMRAYIGDIIIKKGSGDKQFSFEPINKCPDVDITKIDDIVMGGSHIRTASNSACVKSGDLGVIVSVENKLTTIAAKLKAKTALSASEFKFLGSMPFNIYRPLSYAVRNNSEAEYISNFKHTIASIMAYALVEDLVGRIRNLIQVARNNANFAKNGTNNNMCEPAIVAPLIRKIKEFGDNAVELQKAARLAKREHVKEVNNNIKYNQSLSKPTQ